MQPMSEGAPMQPMSAVAVAPQPLAAVPLAARGNGKEGENFEYGYRLKKFPDDEIRLAFKRTGKSENPIMNWIGSLSNPVNTDNY